MNNGLLILENNATASPMGEFLTRIKEQRDCDYHGVHEFFEFPLLNQDKEAHDLYMEVYFGKDGERFGCNFLQDKSLIRRYIRKCHQLGIKLSYYFIQSDYEREQWEGPLPKMTFVGYEVAEIPLDACAIFDLFIYERYNKYSCGLNKSGLFMEKTAAEAFLREYKEDLKAGTVGDGEVALYVLCLNRVTETDLIKVLDGSRKI